MPWQPVGLKQTPFSVISFLQASAAAVIAVLIGAAVGGGEIIAAGMLLAAIAGAAVMIFIFKRPYYGIFLVFFSILLPLRIPLGSGSVSLTWPVILLLVSFYVLRGLASGFKPFPRWPLAAFTAFTLFAFLSLLGASDPAYGFKKLILWSISALLFFVVTDIVLRSKKNINAYIDILFLAGIIVGLIGVMFIILGHIFGTVPVSGFLFFKLYPLIRSEGEMLFQQAIMAKYHAMFNWTEMGGRVFRNISIFLSPIATSAFFGILTPLAMSIYLHDGKQRRYFFIFYFFVLSIILTLSRGAWIGALVSLGFVFLMGRGFKKKLLVALLAAAGLMLMFTVTDIFITRISGPHTASASVSTRWTFLLRGFEVGVENFITGVGFNNYELVVRSNIHEYPHNQYVEILAETGLGGLVSYMFLLWIFLRNNWRRIGKSGDLFSRAFYTGITASIAFWAVHSFFEDLLTSPPALLTFLTVLAIAEAKAIADSDPPRGGSQY